MATIVVRRWLYKGQVREAYRVRYVDRTGRRRAKQFDKRKDAADFARTCEGSSASARGGLTVAEAAQNWLDACEKGLGEHAPVELKTYRQYNGHVVNHINPRLGDRAIGSIDSNAVKGFRDNLIKDRVSRSTAKKILVSLRGILAHSKDRGDIRDNPALGIRIVINKREKEKVEIPSKEEMRHILETADKLAKQDNLQYAKAWRRYRTMIMFDALSGLRASELRGLPWPNVDLKLGTVTVSQRADEYKQIGRPKSFAGERTIEIPAALVGLLREWRWECPPSVNKLVFPNWRGNVESLANIHRRGWYPLQERAGVVDEKGKGKYTFHALRHFRASVLIDRGATPKEVMVEIGHSSIQVTFDTYGHLFKDGQDRRKQRAEEIATELLPVGTGTSAPKEDQRSTEELVLEESGTTVVQRIATSLISGPEPVD